MGAPKVKEVGGGQATPLANSFNDFLLQGLTSGSFGNVRTPEQIRNNNSRAQAETLANKGGLWGSVGQKALAKLPPATPMGNTGGLGANPVEGQNQTHLFGNTINQLLGGQIGDPSSYQGFFEGLQGNNGGLPNLNGVSYNNPQFAQAQFNAAPGFQNMNLDQYMGQMGGSGLGQYQQMLGNIKNLNIPSDFNISQGLPTNFETPEAQAIQQIIGRNMDKSVADMRARYGSGGGTAYGTGAAFAEGNLRAEANPLIAQALSQVNRQERELDLANRGMVGNLLLGQRGQDSENARFGGQLAQSGSQASAANKLGLIAMMLQQSLAGNQYGMDAAGMANNFGLQNAGMQNNFNLANAGQQLGADQFNVNAALQNQQMQNQFGLGKAGIGLGMQGNQLGAQQGMLGQLFGAMNTGNQLGTSQRQLMASPSTGSQIFNGVMGAGGMLAGLATGNPFAIAGGAQGLMGAAGGGSLMGSAPFMNSNPGLFSGQNLGMGGYNQSPVNPSSLFTGQNLGMQTGGPNMQSTSPFANGPQFGGNFGGQQAFPNMMNAMPQLGGFSTNPQLRALLGF